MKNVEIMNQLFIIKTLLGKAGSKEIFWEEGLTVSLYELLKIILNGANEVLEMKKYSVESSASLTQKIQKLEKLGLIKREVNKYDKRRLKFSSTEKGEKTIIRVEKKNELASSAIFFKYSKKEKEIFVDILKNLEKFLSKKVSEIK